MLQFEEKIHGCGHAEKIWRLYSEVNQWKLWDKSIQSVVISGEFAAGTSGIMEMPDGSRMPFVITECDAPHSFSTKSELGNICIFFIHQIEQKGEQVGICHKVVIDGGPEKQMAGIGQQIASGLSDCLQNLITLSNKL